MPARVDGWAPSAPAAAGFAQDVHPRTLGTAGRGRVRPARFLAARFLAAWLLAAWFLAAWFLAAWFLAAWFLAAWFLAVQFLVARLVVARLVAAQFPGVPILAVRAVGWVLNALAVVAPGRPLVWIPGFRAVCPVPGGARAIHGRPAP